MAQTVADYVLARLREWGVEKVFGYAGDGINGLLAAWGRADDQPMFVQARHEEMAAFEAVGDAKLDHVPVVAIVGQTARSAMGGSYQQEVDLQTLYKDVASAYVETVTVPQ